jgi:predicted dehydrogenase
VRWGIAATGGIATSFAKALASVEDASLQAVSSRSLDRASAFAAEHGAARAYASLAKLLDDPDVDIVYVASPHSEHCREALAAIEAGKHVLVEKPFGLNARETAKVLDAAASARVFAMEALWSRFLPAHVRLRELVAEGAIGEIRSVEASFGFPFPYGPEHRLFDPALGGGSLLDLGIYPVNMALQLLGPPEEVAATAVLGETGVDVNTLVALRFAGGAVASAHSSLTAMLSNTARVIGTQGSIELPGMHHCAQSLVLRNFGSWPEPPSKEVLELPVGDDGLRYEVQEVHRCLAEGRQQSSVMSWQHTLDLMTTLDRARECIGLRYPHER